MHSVDSTQGDLQRCYFLIWVLLLKATSRNGSCVKSVLLSKEPKFIASVTFPSSQ